MVILYTYVQYSILDTSYPFVQVMVKVNVLTLDSELLCSVEIEPGCTGRQLKEAIEEATEWMDLVCTQTLVLGVNTILDDEVGEK